MAELFPPVSDEMLMAYADDALEPAERARVETALTGREIIPERMTVVSKAADDADPRDKNTLHADIPKSCFSG